MVLNTKMTQKIGHTTSPSQKILDSALDDELRLCFCEETQKTISFYTNPQKVFENNTIGVPIVPHFSVAVLRYTILNCPIRSISYITPYKDLEKCHMGS